MIILDSKESEALLCRKYVGFCFIREEMSMETGRRMRGITFPAVLTAVCLLGAADLGMLGLGVRPAQAQSCSNSRCSGTSSCIRQVSEACSFPDARSCITTRCAFNGPGPAY
jgi:hypothetical protein